jgi:RNase H-fold protein (predicted Holliday junction resolvase)
MVSRSTWKTYETRIARLLWGIKRVPLSGINSEEEYGDCKGAPFTIEVKKWTNAPSMKHIVDEILPKLLHEAELNKKPGVFVFSLPNMKDEDSIVFTNIKTFRSIFIEHLNEIKTAIDSHDERLKTYLDKQKEKVAKRKEKKNEV